jgi:hypothetical protein
MDNIIDLIATDSSPAEITDSIKSAIFAKSAEKIDQIRPYIAASLFDSEESENSFEDEDNI